MAKPGDLSTEIEIENNHHKLHIPMQINLSTTPAPISPLSTRIQDYLSEESFYNLVNEISDEPTKSPQKVLYY